MRRTACLANAIVVVAVIVFTFTGCGTGSDSDTEEAPRNSNENVYTSDAYKAFAISKGLAKDNLKSPSTAKFPLYSEYSEGVHVVDKGDWFFVASYVDSQNGFGAMIRTKYLCSVNKSTWNVDEFTFDTE